MDGAREPGRDDLAVALFVVFLFAAITAGALLVG
jgi:hypothetical protein